MGAGHLLACFFGGAFLINALPHLVAGTMGRAFQSPFASPPGKGLSSATVNVVWGCANLVMFYWLTFKAAAIEMIVAQGGIVGWATPLSALQEAVVRENADA